jgi:hypothetical protein
MESNFPKGHLYLALVGLALPYIATLLIAFLFKDKIGDHSFYLSGKLSLLDTISQWIILSCLLLGAFFCIPIFKYLVITRYSLSVSFIIASSLLLIQFVVVFVFRFIIHVKLGGIL